MKYMLLRIGRWMMHRGAAIYPCNICGEGKDGRHQSGCLFDPTPSAAWTTFFGDSAE